MSWRDWLPPYRPGGQPTQPLGCYVPINVEVTIVYPPPPIFDWERDCPDDFPRRTWPAVAGPGRGTIYEPPA